MIVLSHQIILYVLERVFKKKYRTIDDKISISSGKIDKYECLTVDEILPPDQNRAIEQVKITYSPLGKTFGKQVKTIENQGEKQIKTLEEDGKRLVQSSGKKESLLKQKQVFGELADERMGKTQNLSNQINFNNLIYHFKGESGPKHFITFEGSLGFYKNIEDSYTSLEIAKENQKKKSDLNEIVREKWKYKSKEQKSAIKNIKNCYESQEKFIKLFNDYSKIASKAKYRSIYGEGLNILTPRQMLQGLSIAPAQLKQLIHLKSY